MGAGKKKWSAKGRVKDKLQNKVIFDQETYDRLLAEVPKYRLITPAVVSDRLKITGSLARAALVHLEEKGVITKVVHHKLNYVYTTTAKAAPAAAPAK